MKIKKISGIILLIVFTLTGCSKTTHKPLTKTDIMLDTVISITLYDSKNPQIVDEAFDLCHSYEEKFSRTIKTSEISKINHAGGKPVKVSSDTFELVEKGVYYSRLSGGKFDITIAPLSELWDFKNNPGNIPDAEAIKEARSHVNYKAILFNSADSTIQLSDPQAAIDLGGIAKGYIADRIKEYLKAAGIKQAIIDLGGNVLTVGGKNGNTPYNIGIQKPFADKNETAAAIKVLDQSIVTSGIYERYFKVNDKIYHHILDPQSGYPCETDVIGVTIRSDNSADGDALSTICLSLGLEEGLAFINQIDSASALFITKDNQLHYSKGFQ